MSAVMTAPPARSPRLVERFAERFHIEPNKLLDTLRATAFKTDTPATNEQMLALLVVAEQYNLNPFTKELFAFVDKHGGVVPSVSVDGWARIVNEHPQYDGAEFHYASESGEMTCTMYRKDRSHPTVLTEYMVECKRSSIPWQVTPRRMLRHRSFIQAARLTFGFAGIYDESEARDIITMSQAEVIDSQTGEISSPPWTEAEKPPPRSAVEKAREALRGKVRPKGATPPEKTAPEAAEPPPAPPAVEDWPPEPPTDDHEA